LDGSYYDFFWVDLTYLSNSCFLREICSFNSVAILLLFSTSFLFRFFCPIACKQVHIQINTFLGITIALSQPYNNPHGLLRSLVLCVITSSLADSIFKDCARSTVNSDVTFPLKSSISVVAFRVAHISEYHKNYTCTHAHKHTCVCTHTRSLTRTNTRNTHRYTHMYETHEKTKVVLLTNPVLS
jgi:hypothetical protein